MVVEVVVLVVVLVVVVEIVVHKWWKLQTPKTCEYSEPNPDDQVDGAKSAPKSFQINAKLCKRRWWW